MADVLIPNPGSLGAADELEGLSEKPKSFGRLAFERFVRHKLALIGVVGLLLIAFAFIIGPSLSGYSFDDPDVLNRLQGPSGEHWFGTDEIGRDLFTRTARGGRYSLSIGLLAATVATAFGTLMGATAGYFGKTVDVVISQVINLILVVPAILILSLFFLYPISFQSLAFTPDSPELQWRLFAFAGLSGLAFLGSFFSTVSRS